MEAQGFKIALVCIAKNEENYIQEWIDYHQKIGFDDIFIYQNNWRWSGNCKNVIKIEFDGDAQQLNSYHHFIENNKSYHWAMFLDVDEFLVLKKHKNIKKFISDYKDYNAVGINWVFFGDNNLEYPTDNDFSVIKRFTKRDKKISNTIKSIVNLKKNIRFKNPHSINKNWVDTNFNLRSDSDNKEGSIDIAQINHYFCKTKDEFYLKINRGRADILKKRDIKEFEIYNKNEIEDTLAYNIMYNDNNSILNS